MDLENFVLGIFSEHENFKDVGDLKRQVYLADASKVVDRLQKWVDNSYFITWDEMTERIENEIKFLEGELEKIGKPVLLPTTKSGHGARAKSQFPEYLKNLCALRYLQLRLAERRQTSDEPGNQAGKDTAPPPKKYVVSDSLKKVVHQALIGMKYIGSSGNYIGGHVEVRALFVALRDRGYLLTDSINSGARKLETLFKSRYEFQVSARTIKNGVKEVDEAGEKGDKIRKLVGKFQALIPTKSNS